MYISTYDAFEFWVTAPSNPNGNSAPLERMVINMAGSPHNVPGRVPMSILLFPIFMLCCFTGLGADFTTSDSEFICGPVASIIICIGAGPIHTPFN